MLQLAFFCFCFCFFWQRNEKSKPRMSASVLFLFSFFKCTRNEKQGKFLGKGREAFVFIFFNIFF